MSLLVKIERHLRHRAVPPSRFGRQATGDPRFVFDLRRGREPRAEMAARVLAFIAHAEGVPIDAGDDGDDGAPVARPAAARAPAAARFAGGATGAQARSTVPGAA